MPALTDSAIRAAIRAALPRTLSDGGSRGQGRLVMTIRPQSDNVAAEWYAQSWRRGRRALAKIGGYPDVSLAEARVRFAREFAGVDVARPKLKSGTVADLFSGYVAALRARGAPSADDVATKLDAVAAELGRDRPAAAVTADDVVEILRPIYARGSKSMADHVRGYIRAAYGWGISSDRDYRVAATARYRLQGNPADGIPTEPKVAGTRWLSREEFLLVWRYLESPSTPVTPAYMDALRVMMATGQRVREIARLRADQWDSGERVLTWERTKNGRPHVIPVARIAAEILDSIRPNEHGLLFPSVNLPARPVTEEVLYSCLWRNRQQLGIAPFTNRDLRRTWKTLAGEAGLSKEDRDRLQNHGRWDVSTKHYDRWQYLPEMRAAVARWSTWLDALVGRETTEGGRDGLA